MGIVYNSRIVTNGLVVYLDAANRRSYPETGTDWFDLSGQGANASLLNGVGYVSDNGGSFNFDGTNDVISVPNSYLPNELFADTGSSWTVTCWFNFPTSPGGQDSKGTVGSYGLLGRGGGIGSSGQFLLFVGLENYDSSPYTELAPFKVACWLRGVGTVISSSSVNTDTNNYAALTWDGSSGFGYFNNESAVALNVGTRNLQTYTSARIGGNPSGAGHYYFGKIFQVSIYNRALSAAEIAQNFNATRGRFGI